jgi:hypothetical protein
MENGFVTWFWVLGIAIVIIGSLASILISVLINALNRNIKANKDLGISIYELGVKLEVEKSERKHVTNDVDCLKKQVSNHEGRIIIVEQKLNK